MVRVAAVVILGVLAFGTTVPRAAQAQDAAGPTVTVQGVGEVSAPPDMAIVSVGVAEEADEARAALSAMNDAATAVIERLRRAGVSDADLQTGALRLDPRYRASSLSGESRVDGYRASTMLTVRVRDLEVLGGLLDAVVGDGANQLSGLRFDLSESKPLRDAARRAAIADAIDRAALYADAAGLALGEVRLIRESGGSGGPEPMALMMEARSSGVPVEAGEIQIVERVTVVFALTPAQ